jgi:hypothetical protein
MAITKLINFSLMVRFGFFFVILNTAESTKVSFFFLRLSSLRAAIEIH